jgi:hypothetical protein
MIASIVIIVVSIALVAYWLRYTCLLLLHDHQPAAETAFPLFQFQSVRRRLEGGVAFSELQQALDRDFAALSYLIDSTAGSDIEARLLVWDYRLVRLWFGVSHAILPVQGRRALAEMTDVLAVLANKLRDTTAAAPESA